MALITLPLLGAIILAVILSVLTFSLVYQWALALVVLTSRNSPLRMLPDPSQRFVILIPAHNEESSIGATLLSIRNLEYASDRVRTLVIADRCSDRTATVVAECGFEVLARSSGVPGKGAAIAWAIEHVKEEALDFDAIVILDADTLVDKQLLRKFSAGISLGHQIQQGYSYISNPWESPFTRIIAVTSLLRNRFFYAAKEMINASAMLVGTGMCFSKKVFDRHSWDAFSMGEDWEFSATLHLAGEKIHFNAEAIVYPLESRGFRQASKQRLRWASGRYAVASKRAMQLLTVGLRQKSFVMVDAAITLVVPNFSAQATLSCSALFMGWLLLSEPAGWILLAWASTAFVGLGGYFLLGAFHTESPWKAIAGIPLIPIFLPWRMTIEILGLLGFGRKVWLRTPRQLS